MPDDLKVVVVSRDLYYHEITYVRGLENLAQALLLFHKGTPWTTDDQNLWVALTGVKNVNTKELCDFARRVTNSADPS